MSRTTVRGTSLWLWLVDAVFSSVGWIVWQVLRGVGWLGYRLLLWAVAHPRTSLTIGTLTGAVLLIGWQWVVGIVGVAVLSGSVWKAGHRASFDASVGAWLQTWYRTWRVYRRRWEHVMNRCGLRVDEDGQQYYPRLRKVSTTPYWDRLTIEMEDGQELSDYEGAAERLRNAFKAQRISVREVEPSRVGVDLMRRDPFRHEVIGPAPMPSATEEIDWTQLPIGLTEQLQPLTVSMVGGHTAAAGTTGAGKASVEWNILRCMAPAIADGTCRPVFIDPKARELRRGIELVDAGVFGTSTPELTTRGRVTSDETGPKPSGDYAVTEWDTVCLLERIATEVHEANLAGAEAGERDFEPSQETPLRPIFIDELAPLLLYWSRGAQERIESALGIILTQGRAAGYIVVACIQEPTKDVFTVRDLFGRRIGLRLPTEDHTDAALTDNAVARGAECHKIPESLPGVLFSFREGDSKAVRARLGHVQDDDIDELVEYVAALRSVTTLPVDQPVETTVEEIPADEAGQMRTDEAA